MKVATMRRLDRWLGLPVCFALTQWRRLFGRQVPDPSRPIRRVLFIKLAEQGSTVLAYPLLRDAAERFGKDNLFFLLFAENRPVLDFLDVVPADNVLAIDTGRGIFRTILGAMRTLKRLRNLDLDAAVDLEFFARSTAALSYLSGAERRVGFHAFGGEASYRGDLLTHRLSFNPYLHTSTTFRLMLDALGHPPERFPAFPQEPVDPEVSEATFLPSPGEIEGVRRLLERELGSADRPLILLNANASDLMPLRRWEPARYVDLACRLLERFPECGIVFTGAPSEAQATEVLAGQAPSGRCVSLAGKTSFRQLIVLYTLAEVLVTNDSGPAHFATLTPIDVVVLFGPETPKLFAARSPRTHVHWAGLACSPCINAFNDRVSACRDNVCMRSITVDQVFETTCRVVQARLERRSALRPAA